MREAGHPIAFRGAASARFSALFHRFTGKSFAGLGASAADRGASGAGVFVQGGASQHEVGARGADLGAIDERSDVARLSVLPAHFKAALDGLDADPMAILARFDAALHWPSPAGRPRSTSILDRSLLRTICHDVLRL